MSTDSPPTTAAPRCTATTRGGEPCKAYAVKGSSLCRGHSMSPEEKAALRAASAAKATERRETREHAEETARLGVQALLGRQMEADAEAITARLRALALSSDDATSRAGLQLWFDRVLGRAVQPTRDETAERNPVLDAFASLSPDERRQLLRLAQPLPDDPETASVQG